MTNEEATEVLKNEAKYKKALKMACDELAAVTHTQYQESADVVSRAYVTKSGVKPLDSSMGI